MCANGKLGAEGLTISRKYLASSMNTEKARAKGIICRLVHSSEEWKSPRLYLDIYRMMVICPVDGVSRYTVVIQSSKCNGL